jgi:hypothetical protein
MNRNEAGCIWAERWAANGQRPLAFGRHKQSAGTVCVRPQFTEPARLAMCLPVNPACIAVPSGDRPAYSLDEGLV